MLGGAALAAVDSGALAGSGAASATNTFQAKVITALAPIDSKLPLVQNVGIWIVVVGAVMRFGFGK
jgi:hypothetical protein